MSIFSKFVVTEQEHINTLYLRDDYIGSHVNLPIKRKLVQKEKDEGATQAWPYDPRLRIRLKIGGKDLGIVYPICNRNAIIDPLGKTGDDLKGKKLREHLLGITGNEFHTARGKKIKDATEKSTVILSIGAAVLTILFAFLIVYKVYM